MAVKRPGVVSLRKGHTWTFPHSCRTATRTFMQMATENKPAIAEVALPTVGLGAQARRAQDNPIKLDKKGRGGKRGEMNWIDKALAAELHMATILTCLDSPKKVFAPCKLDPRGRPTRYAGAGKPDAWAKYPGFAILIEVSTKTTISHKNFRSQMTQAVKHGKKLSRKLRRPVYALVVNNRDVETQMDFRAIYRKARKEAVKPGKKRSARRGDVRPIALQNLSVVLILETIHAIDAEDFQFDASALRQALQTIYDGLGPDENKSLTGGWSAKTAIKLLRVQQDLLPSGPSLDT